MPYTLSTAWIVPGKSERLRSWYRELEERRDEAFETLDNEGVRQEVAFILDTDHGELLAVFIEVDDMAEADNAFFSSPYEIDHQHRQVMDECTVGGSTGRVHAELMYAFQNPPHDARSELGATP
jgi:Family of unknown function (DUF6176)